MNTTLKQIRKPEQINNLDLGETRNHINQAMESLDALQSCENPRDANTNAYNALQSLRYAIEELELSIEEAVEP